MSTKNPFTSVSKQAVQEIKEAGGQVAEELRDAGVNLGRQTWQELVGVITGQPAGPTSKPPEAAAADAAAAPRPKTLETDDPAERARALALINQRQERAGQIREEKLNPTSPNEPEAETPSTAPSKTPSGPRLGNTLQTLKGSHEVKNTV